MKKNCITTIQSPTYSPDLNPNDLYTLPKIKYVFKVCNIPPIRASTVSYPCVHPVYFEENNHKASTNCELKMEACSSAM